MLSTNEIVLLEGSDITLEVQVVMNSILRARDVVFNVTNSVDESSVRYVISPGENSTIVYISVPLDDVVGPDRMFTLNFVTENDLDMFVTNSTVDVVILDGMFTSSTGVKFF